MGQKQHVINYLQNTFKEDVKIALCNGPLNKIKQRIDLLAERATLDIINLLKDDELEQAKKLLERATRLEPNGLETYKLTVSDFLNGELTSLRNSAEGEDDNRVLAMPGREERSRL